MESDFVRPPEAPVFEPTEEEFQDPFAYLEKIRHVAEACGICKIRPPETWQPPFAVDVDSFRFTPRVQRLNELEAKTRVKLSFLDHLAKFWELQGIPLKIPMIDKKYLDLYSLHKVVQSEGGFEMLTRNCDWQKVVSKLGYKDEKNIDSLLGQNYEKILYPYDIFISGATTASKDDDNRKDNDAVDDDETDDVVFVKVEQGSSPASQDTKPAPVDDQLKADGNSDGGDGNTNAESTTNVDVKDVDKKQTVTSELKKLQFYGAGPKAAVPNASKDVDKSSVENTDSKHKTRRTRVKRHCPTFTSMVKVECESCGTEGSVDELLMCDSCGHAYHCYCLVPPLPDVPRRSWRCAKCIAKVCQRPSMKYGFEQAETEYTLQSFGEMADKFKLDYFSAPIHTISCATVEKEFWRLVNCIEEDVVVEYGADNPVGDECGSGFPTEKTQHLFPDDETYVRSPWNLNNLPVNKKSLLSYVTADISGMKVPWCYVGMCFSCFAWHTEDHWTFSINYMHWGEPKTWYGVPRSKAEMLEDVMKQTAPELFEQSPDLLHQLTTTLNPNTLMNAGVPVVRTDQHAGEIIITFPRAYHAGFNQGYNFAEAVNFSVADWLPVGRASVEHYRLLKRQCVFSHDELVCKMAALPSGTLSPHQMQIVYKDLLTMVDEEKKARKRLHEKGTTEADRAAFELLPDDERQCDVCKTTCFLSAVTCDCSDGRVVCVSHADELCDCGPSRHCLRYRHTLNELLSLLSRLKDNIAALSGWLARVKAARTGQKADDGALRALLSEGKELQYTDSPAYVQLSRVIDTVDTCADIVQWFSADKLADCTDAVKKFNTAKPTLKQLRSLVSEIPQLSCIVKDETALQSILDDVERFQSEVGSALGTEQLDADTLDQLLTSNILTKIDLPERNDLQRAQRQLEWLGSIQHKLSPGTAATLQDVRRLIETGLRLGKLHSSCERAVSDLRKLISTCQHYELKAARLLSNKPYAEPAKLTEMIEESKVFSLQLPWAQRLSDALQQANSWTAAAEELLSRTDRPSLREVKDMVEKSRQIPVSMSVVPQLEAKITAVKQWRQTAKRAFISTKNSCKLLEALCPRSDVVTSQNNKSTAQPDSTHPDNITVDKLKDGERAEMTSVLDLRVLNRHKVSDGYTGVCCTCRRPRSGSMLRCQLCLELFHSSCVATNQPKLKKENDDVGVKNLLTSGPAYLICRRCCRTLRPPINTVRELLSSSDNLGVTVPETVALQRLIERVDEWREKVQAVLANEGISEIHRLISTNTSCENKPTSNDGETPAPTEQSDLLSSLKNSPEFETALASVPTEMIDQLTVLVIEGDLLQVDVDELDSLRRVLAACDPDNYSIKVFEFEERNMNGTSDRRKLPTRYRAVTSKKRQSQNMSRDVDADEIILIDDDDDDDDDADDDAGSHNAACDDVDDDDYVVVETCAADKCRKFVGEEASLIQCGICCLYFHFCCIGLDPASNITAFTCSRCKPTAGQRRNIPRPSIGHRRGHVTIERDGMKCVDDDLLDDFFDGETNGPTGSKTDIMKLDDFKDDDGDDDDDDDDCIIID